MQFFSGATARPMANAASITDLGKSDERTRARDSLTACYVERSNRPSWNSSALVNEMG